VKLKKKREKIRRAQRIKKRSKKPFSCLEESEGIVGREREEEKRGKSM